MTTDNPIEYLEPMTEEAITDYAATVAKEMDEESIISGAGMEFITRDDNIPNEEDQERIMTKIEELHNDAQKDTVDATEGDSSTGEDQPTTDQEEAKSEAESTFDVAATSEAVVEEETTEAS